MFLPGDPYSLLYLMPAVAGFYLLRTAPLRLLYLLALSLAYYSSFSPAFFLPLAFVFAASYAGALVVNWLPDNGQRSAAFWLAAVLVLLPLAFYKYIVPGIFSGNAAAGYDWALTAGRYAIPIGISYYTFAALGYVCDVYLGLMRPEKRPHHVALYLSFFPHVTAGPIPRGTHFLPQLQLNTRFDADQMMAGIRLILVGASMKLWFADSLSAPVNLVFQKPEQASALENLFAGQIFAFQLYADFAGYSLIAIGAARLLGITLGDNFRQPFLSRTLPEFWRSWHISLFTWLRDYVFTPLRMHWRKWPVAGSALAIVITLGLVGIWHGTSWGFVLFGTIHGVFLALSMQTLAWRNALWQRFAIPAPVVNTIRILITFNIVALTLILIRAKDLPQAFGMYGRIFSPALLTDLWSLGRTARILMFDSQTTNLALIGVIIIGDLIAKNGLNFERVPRLAQSFVYSICILAVLYQGISANASKPFIYFQF
jgi:D-alanyl-lipoteichoic acid acyltransferase DltB (MBOAT superfamily)